MDPLPRKCDVCPREAIYHLCPDCGDPVGTVADLHGRAAKAEYALARCQEVLRAAKIGSGKDPFVLERNIDAVLSDMSARSSVKWLDRLLLKLAEEAYGDGYRDGIIGAPKEKEKGIEAIVKRVDGAQMSVSGGVEVLDPAALLASHEEMRMKLDSLRGEVGEDLYGILYRANTARGTK